jgi:hypothetical protein
MRSPATSHRIPSMLSPRIISRRTALLALLPLAAQAQPLRRPPPTPNADVIQHRGFTMRVATPGPDRAALEAAMKHQLDIVADCGAKPEILALWRTIPIALAPGDGEPGGNFKPGRGVEIYAAPIPPPENPVVLHELVHALHYRYVPQSNNNPDIERFYRIAVDNVLYPQGAYVLKNRNEFFAVTGSLYLWGKVAKPPHDRATLFAKQPRYYEWLGELFGVKKKPQDAEG